MNQLLVSPLSSGGVINFSDGLADSSFSRQSDSGRGDSGKDANNLVAQAKTADVSIQIGRDSGGRHLEVARTIEADATAVWEALVDVREWPEWGPSVTAVKCQHRRIRAGSTGRVCVFGIWLPFEVDSYSKSEPKRWSWQIRGFSATGHRVEQFEGPRCRAVFEIPLYAVWYAPVCQVALSRIERIATSPEEL